MDIKDKLNSENVATYYHMATFFNLNFTEVCLNYTERYFTIVAESESFLHLDFKCVKEILSSSELDITSELEVLKAAESWIAKDYKNRSKYAKDLLLLVRLHLLSLPVLESILKPEKNDIRRSEDLTSLVNETIQNKRVERLEAFSQRGTRYCEKKRYSIFVTRFNRRIMQIDGETIKNARSYEQYPGVNDDYWIVCVKHRVYVVYYSTYLSRLQIYNYSKRWTVLRTLKYHHKKFSTCGFMDKMFMIGGCDRQNKKATDLCLEFSTTTRKTKEWKNVIEARRNAASAVFEGRVVVAGGVGNAGLVLNSVEAFDHVANQWSHLPSMINRRRNHKLVPVRNKLFVLGGQGGGPELYDSSANEFVTLQQPRTVEHFGCCDAVPMGNCILILTNYPRIMVTYNMDTDEWTREDVKSASNNSKFPCLTLHKVDYFGLGIFLF